MMLHIQSLFLTIAVIISPSFPYPMLNSRNDEILDSYPSEIALSDTNAGLPIIDSIRIWNDNNQPPIDLNENFVLSRYPEEKPETEMKLTKDQQLIENLRTDDSLLSYCSEGRIEISFQEIANCLAEVLRNKSGNWNYNSKVANDVEWKRRKRQMDGGNSTQNIQRIVQEIMNKRLEAKFNPTGW